MLGFVFNTEDVAFLTVKPQAYTPYTATVSMLVATAVNV